MILVFHNKRSMIGIQDCGRNLQTSRVKGHSICSSSKSCGSTRCVDSSHYDSSHYDSSHYDSMHCDGSIFDSIVDTNI